MTTTTSAISTALTILTTLTTSTARAHGLGSFRVQPQVVARYAEALREQASVLAHIEAGLAMTVIDETWFGRLPDAGRLADNLRTQREMELGMLAGVARALGMAGEQLAGNVATYAEALSLIHI